MNARDLVVWKWKKGEETLATEFGDPLMGGTSYAFCVYQYAAGVPSLALEVKAPEAGICAGRPCWKKTKSGYRYGDVELTPEGMRVLKLRSGGPGKAKLIVRARGQNLQMPALPLSADPQIRALVYHTGGGCWMADFPVLRKNTATLVKAKNF